MSLEVYTPIDSVPKANNAVIKMKREFNKKKGYTPLEVRRRRGRIIEAFDVASSASQNREVSRIYKTAKRDLEEREYKS